MSGVCLTEGMDKIVYVRFDSLEHDDIRLPLHAVSNDLSCYRPCRALEHSHSLGRTDGAEKHEGDDRTGICTVIKQILG